MSDKTKDLGASVGFAVKANPIGLRQLLGKYGIRVGSSQKELIGKTIDAFDEKGFLKDYQSFLSDTVGFGKNFSGNYNNFTGALSGATSGLNAGGSGGGGFDWGGAIGGALALGGSIFGGAQQSKLQKEQAKLAAQQSADALELAKIQGASAIQLAQIQLQAKQAENIQPPKNNTLVYVGVGLAVVLVVGVLFVALKKK